MTAVPAGKLDRLLSEVLNPRLTPQQLRALCKQECGKLTGEDTRVEIAAFSVTCESMESQMDRHTQACFKRQFGSLDWPSLMASGGVCVAGDGKVVRNSHARLEIRIYEGRRYVGRAFFHGCMCLENLRSRCLGGYGVSSRDPIESHAAGGRGVISGPFPSGDRTLGGSGMLNAPKRPSL